jgi:CheY-like chemotaxis protein
MSVPRSALLPEHADEAEVLRTLIDEALKQFVPPDICRAILDRALRGAGAKTLPTEVDRFCAFVSGPLYAATEQLTGGGTADRLMGELDWVLAHWKQQATSGVRRLDADSDLLAGARVLVVDDEEIARRTLTRGIERFGARAWSASSAEEALMACRRACFDVVVTDYRMQLSSGATLALSLRLAHGDDAPAVICVTGAYPTPSHEDFHAVLMKPVRLIQLVIAIGNAAASARAAHDT